MLEKPPENAVTPGTKATGPLPFPHSESSLGRAASFVGFVSPWASPDELHTWLYASFGVVLILLGSWLVTLDGFASTDKYLLVLILFISAPVTGWILPFLHVRDRWTQDLVLSEAILLLNLAFIFVGSIWLGATSHDWVQV